MRLQLNQLKNNEIYSRVSKALPGSLTLEWVDLSLLRTQLENDSSLNDQSLEAILFGNEAAPVYSGFTETRVLKILKQLCELNAAAPTTAGCVKTLSLHKLTIHPELVSSLERKLSDLRIRNLRKRFRAKGKEFLHRVKASFRLSNNSKGVLRLNLGAGEENYEGYVKVDWAGPQHLFDDIVTLTKIKNDSVDEIYSNHVLEHIPQALIIPMLKRWREVLKPGGTIRLRMPDAKQAILHLGKAWKEINPAEAMALGFPNYLAKESTLSGIVDDDLAIQFIYGWSDSMPNHWDMSNQHKSLWTPELGRKRLEAAGFTVETAKNFGTLQTVLIARK